MPATLADVQSLAAQVLWAVFSLAFLLGVLVRQTHFCTMGAVADIVHLGDWSRMRMWALAAGVVVAGFNGMVALGWVQASNTLYGGPHWLVGSALTGGLLFGFGMVLASGCGSKTLVRVGGGNLKSLVVLLVMGLTGWATLRGLTAVLRVNTVDRLAIELPVSQDLPSLLAHGMGWPVAVLAAGCAVVVGGGLVAWALARPEGRHPQVLVGGVGTGLLVLAMWWVTGCFGFVAEHPETLAPMFLATASQRMESFSFVAPVVQVLEWLVFFSDRSRSVGVGMVAVAGMLSGSVAAALVTRSFRWEGFRDEADMGRHLVGAVLMGVGGVTAMGCTFGQGLSGLSTLGLTSLVAVLAILGGAVLGLRFLTWQLERQA
ncbi:MAG: hypothetical protein RL260_3518 [Pseudomonadota bacterium]|jgi:uncharacterized membrane protein YedE/YeeE